MTDEERIRLLREALRFAAEELSAADQLLNPDGDRWSFAAEDSLRVLAETDSARGAKP